jgi:competence ComEA-like helix-hairpin-helix protein
VSKDTVSKETASKEETVSKETASKETKTESEDIRYVDVNTASYEELVEILGVGAVDAKRIIQEREAIGGFQTAEQIGELLGLKPHQVEKIRKLARFTPIPKKQNNSRVVDY